MNGLSSLDIIEVWPRLAGKLYLIDRVLIILTEGKKKKNARDQCDCL